MKALVDADSLLYKVGFAMEDKTWWNEFDDEDPDITYSTDLKAAYRTFDKLIENLMFATETDEVLLVFTGGDNFRNHFPIGYKEHRKGNRKPESLGDLKAYAEENYDTITTDGIEADDLVVYMKTHGDEDYVLCAIDKDVLYQTEGLHYNYNTDEEVEVSEDEAIRYAYYQVLTGDRSDGYIGCKGIGDKRATAILDGLETEHSMWEAVVSAYESKGQTEEEALWTMRLANMHQWDGKQINLWNPPEGTKQSPL